MTPSLELLQTQAEMLTRAGIWSHSFRPNDLPLHARETRHGFYTRALECLDTASARTRSKRRQKSIQKQRAYVESYIMSNARNIAYCLELRAQRQEDCDAWQTEGYRVFDVIDSYSFSTQPFPFEYACSSARDKQKTLRELGIESKTESPDYVYRSVRCSYWGGTYSNPTGHVVILVKADTPMELELIRRSYREYMDNYWYESHMRHVANPKSIYSSYWSYRPYDARIYSTYFRDWSLR